MDKLLDKKLLGNNVYRLRKERHLTAEYLAEAADMSVYYLREIERGAKKPSLKLFIKLANALGVRANDLLGNITQHNRPLPEDYERSPYFKDLSHSDMLLCLDIVKAMVRNQELKKQEQEDNETTEAYE